MRRSDKRVRRTNREANPGRLRLVGTLIVVAVPLLIVLGTLRPQSDSGGREIRATFDEAKGIAKVERDVRIGGVNSGKITEIRRVGDDAEVTLKLDPGTEPIYADATADLRPHSTFEGSAFVDLDPGTPGSGELRDDQIARTETHTYVSLDQAFRGVDAERRAQLGEITDELSDTATPDVVAAQRKTITRLPQLTRDMGTAARAARGPKGNELGAAVRDLGAVTSTLAPQSGDLSGLLADTRQTLGAIRPQQLDALLAALPSTLAQVRSGAGTASEMAAQLEASAKAAGPVVRRTGPMLKAIDPTLPTATKALKDAPDLLDELRLMLADLDEASVPMQQLLEPIDQAVNTLNNKALPGMAQKGRLGEPAYQQFLSAGGGLTGALSHYQTDDQNPFGAGRFVKIGGNVLDGLLGMQIPQVGGTP